MKTHKRNVFTIKEQDNTDALKKFFRNSEPIITPKGMPNEVDCLFILDHIRKSDNKTCLVCTEFPNEMIDKFKAKIGVNLTLEPDKSYDNMYSASIEI